MDGSDCDAKGQDKIPQLTSQLAVQDGIRFLSEVERAWLTGVIDGEGSIYISKVKGIHHRRGFCYTAHLSVSNSNENFVKKIREIIGVGFIGINIEKRRHWKDRYEYKASSSVLRGILPQILPNLLIQREVAERMLEYLSFIGLNPIDGPMVIPAGYYEKLDSL
jgi:hypothetical protein